MNVEKRNERVPTGIQGFDELLEGGLPKNSRSLVTGGTGSGKTIFCLQYLVNGALKYGEHGVYASFEEPLYEIRRNAARFGWDLLRLEKDGKLVLLDAITGRLDLQDPEKWTLDSSVEKVIGIIDDLAAAVQAISAKRLVVDSIPGIGLFTHPETMRATLMRLNTFLRNLDCTTLMTTETVEGSAALSRFGVEEFLATGIIFLALESRGREFKRKLVIRKMRGVKHSMKEFEMVIADQGIIVVPVQGIA
ncbi:MAG: ATPase domain-containing protein [Candidatus Atabeyarchaeum deiterrae]